MKALGFARTARDIEKYSEDQPRVPAGSGRESGEWTSGDGGGAGAPAQTPIRDAGNTHSPIISDATPDPILPGQQYAQSVPRPDLQDGIAVEPFGEAVVSFNNLPKGSKQVLQYRFFVQDDQTGQWRIGMAFPIMKSLFFRSWASELESNILSVFSREGLLEFGLREL